MPKHRPKQSPTIYDIAELAGVNPSTVSRALSRPGRISPKTEKLIQDAARTLNYRVNPMARALPTGRTNTLGLILADITNPVFFSLVRGAEHSAAQAGYTLVLAESQESGEREAEVSDRVVPSVDGMILVATRQSDEQLRELSERKPLVVINRDVVGVETVVPELEPGIDQALAHLAMHEHRALAYVAGPSDSWMSSARWSILHERALALGMTIAHFGPNAPTLDGGSDVYARVAASGASAVLAYNDLLAIGLLRAAAAHDVSVPAELSVVGFDDIFGADFTTPPLTTIRSPLATMGEFAVGRVLDLLAPGEGGTAMPAPEIVTELVVRGSTGQAA
ncbi:MAG TPA: LacI family DNA-binding transcriptional regulator [Microbacteriaceae bacterium]|jgi:LacI family transcriptional regulator|nr:LacI family DNA-binding transcriptional regulator [Microbacteriaceae bacterium]